MNNEVAKLEFETVSKETSRVYHFPDRSTFAVFHVCKINVRPNGTHRLETTSGAKYIIRAGWVAIEIEAEFWSL